MIGSNAQSQASGQPAEHARRMIWAVAKPTTLLLLAFVIAVSGCDNKPSAQKDAVSDPPSKPIQIDGKVVVEMSELQFQPNQLAAHPGPVTVVAKNVGAVTHEIVVVNTEQAADALPTKDGRVEVGQFDAIGETGDVSYKESKNLTLDLKSGKYVFFCNLPGHYQGGMHGTISVD